MKTLTSFCKEKMIDNAQLSGIGAIKDIEVGAYDLKNQEYITQTFADIWELNGLSYYMNSEIDRSDMAMYEIQIEFVLR